MGLKDLESKYLDVTASSPAIYRGNTLVEPLIHGKNYFGAIYECICTTSRKEPPDAIYIVGWQFDPSLDLQTGKLGTPQAIGQLLAEKAAAGVDVRLILNGNIIFYRTQFLVFRHNLEAAKRLQALSVAGASTPPLAGRVLFDWCGPKTGSQHQKATFIRTGSDLFGFVGGMDMVKDHWDAESHTKEWPDHSPWGWHDVGLKLHGEAAMGVYANFYERWREVTTLPIRHYRLDHGNGQFSSGLLNPDPIVPLPDPLPSSNNDGENSQSVQILRSRFRWKTTYGYLSGGQEWDTDPKGGLYEVYQVLNKSILSAEKYIYIEDQFLDESWNPDNGFHVCFNPMGGIPLGEWPTYSLFPAILKALLEKPDLRAIFVGSGKSDPIDVLPGLRNQTLTSSLETIAYKLPVIKQSNIAVWRVENVTVHSKLVIVDDKFAAIGSANLHSRSMMGTDRELHAAIVADDDLVKNLRCNLWAEHWRLKVKDPRTGDDIIDPAIEPSLRNVDLALGLWRPVWSDDPAMWRTNGKPVGFTFPRGPSGWGGVAPVGPLPLG